MAFRQIVNLSNSIVGVSILSMPYCFKTAGILLSILTIIISSYLNRFACYLIISSARISKRKSFENLAFSIFGSTGKLITEIAILGFLLGSCVAFFVVIGDLCPSLIDQIFKISDYTQVTTRTFSMMIVGMFIALPLALKRRVDPSFSAISMFLYLLLAMNLFTEAFDKLTFEDGKILNRLNYWNFENYWTVLPIFCTCLSCQPQLFEIFDQSTLFSEDKNAVKRINSTIKKAISFCSILYIFVGLFGYLAFLDTNSIEGNLLVDLPPSLFSMLAKLGFLFTIIFSLPICLFPCRTSLHSLLYGKPSASLINEKIIYADTYIPDDRWILLTVLLIVVTICISIIIPHIEFILGLIGSTTGTFVCFILPSIWFLNLTSRTTGERLFAYVVLYFGIVLLVFSTFTLINVDQQELSNQGQLVKNLNLSANRIEKLIDKKDLKPLKDLKLKDESIEIKDNSKNDLKDNSKNDLKDNSKNDLKDNSKNNLKDNSKDDLKDNKLNKSAFINAVETKKKSLIKDKLDEKSIKDEQIKLTKSLLNNQNKTESKLDKIIDKKLNKTVFNNNSKILNNDIKLSNHIKLINDKKKINNKTINKDKDFKK